MPDSDSPSPRPPRIDPLVDADPLYRLERNQNSTRNAIGFAIAVPMLTFLTAFVVAMISRTLGGPLCSAGRATWICSRRFEILFPLLPGLVSVGGTFLAAFITYRVWSRYGRWRPWLAILWVLVPFTLFWITSTGPILIIGQK